MNYLMVGLCLLACYRPAIAAPGISAIWANTGEDKVTQDELRATRGKDVKNSVWDGHKVSIFGAKNEVVAFNVILEAGASPAENVTVTFRTLRGPGGATLASHAAAGNGIFNWVGRPIELFYVRYLQIKGVSRLSYDTYDERHVPKRFRRPYIGSGYAHGRWTDRPDHDKFYPDIAVPLDLAPMFTIAAGKNQSIWVDVYIPKDAATGQYLGSIVVKEAGTVVGSLPVELKVYRFTLPDTPEAKTMLYIDNENINHRFVGPDYFNPDTPAAERASRIRDRFYLLAHRHKMALIGDSPGDCGSTADAPCPATIRRLDGSLFTAANGYDGPGVDTGNGVYSIGTYGSWSWSHGTEADMRRHTDAWATWFNQHSPNTEYFLYLIDESSNTRQIETWAQWVLNNPGPGHQVRTLATISLPTAAAQTPALDIPTSSLGVGMTAPWETAAQRYTHDARKRFYMYNGGRPATGSTAIEDDGVALRERAWGQYKKHIQRWFFWETTYYNNYQGGMGETNVFQQAMTFGKRQSNDPDFGDTGWNYSNGDGVLFYPGTDHLFPADSYGVDGPLASLRLKYWRRGIQDVDYLKLAAAVNPAATQALIEQMVPKVLWDYGVDNPADPTYRRTDISWSTDPDVWEAARLRLAKVIDPQ